MDDDAASPELVGADDVAGVAEDCCVMSTSVDAEAVGVAGAALALDTVFLVWWVGGSVGDILIEGGTH